MNRCDYCGIIDAVEHGHCAHCGAPAKYEWMEESQIFTTDACTTSFGLSSRVLFIDGVRQER
jgi:uncharacterized OB-fold protein